MTHTAAEPPDPGRTSSSVRRKPLLYYRPHVLKIIRLLEQSETVVAVQWKRPEPPPNLGDDSTAGNGNP
jgi:hypothetical protein